MSQLVKTVSQDYVRRGVISLVSTLAVVPLFCVCIVIPLWMVTSRDASIWVLVGSSILFLLALFGGGGLAVVLSLSRRARWLNEAFTPLGLTGNSYLLTGRRYQGTVEGRGIDARFYRGPTVDLYVDTSLQTRLGVASAGPLGVGVAQLAGRELITPPDPDLHHLRVFAMDEAWARSLLANPEAKAAIARLLDPEQGSALIRQIHFQPGAILFRLYRSKQLFAYRIEPDEAATWLDDLLALARVAETLPAPQVTAEESGAERLVRSGKISSWMPLVAVGVFLGIILCGASITAILLLLANVG